MRPSGRDGVSAGAQFVGGGPFDYRFCAPVHLLIACERAVRSAGETSVGRSLKSSRRDVGGTLSLAPLGDELCGTFVPRVCPRTTYIYFSPKTLVEDGDIDFTKVGLTPRLFFENAALWASATKLSRLVENPGTARRLYAETSLPARQFFLRSEATAQRRHVGGDERRSTWLMLSSISAVGRCSCAAARAFPIARSAFVGRTLSIPSKASG
jgi:hypothetical protein